MAKSTVTGLLLLGAVLVGTTVPAVFIAADAQSRIGVAAGTAGDPLGKPPSEPERVLRVGTDVQANEVITTKEDDRAHLLFLDGTTLTVGPNAQLMIDKFVYDPATKKGELAINAGKGVFRLIGGRISKTAQITVTTPSSTLGIRGGIMIFGVGPTQTTSIFVFGISMTVSANGQTQTVTQPSSQVVTSQGSPPGAPTPVTATSLSGTIGQLVASTKSANAAVVNALTTLVANNLNNAAVLASIISLVQTIISQNQALALTATSINPTFAPLIPIFENTTQNFASPN